MKIPDFIINFVDDFFDRLKVKNPTAYLILLAVLTAAVSAIQVVMSQPGFNDVIVELFGMQFGVLKTVQGFLIALGFASGTHTPNGKFKVSKAEPTPAWIVDNSYSVGEIVKQDGKTYISQQSHKSTKMNQPEVDIKIGGGVWKKA